MSLDFIDCAVMTPAPYDQLLHRILVRCTGIQRLPLSGKFWAGHVVGPGRHRIRFTGDAGVPDERFSLLRDRLGEDFIAVEIDSSPNNPVGADMARSPR